jgi:cardiolipin synthase
VLVRVLVDDVGAHYSRPNMVRLLQQDDVPTAAFLPVRLPRISRYTNLRNHRKLLVVDGRIGFTGGTNIREGHQLNLQPSSPVQCLHFQLEGPVVGHLQETFAVDWEFTTGESLRGSAWFPDLECVGPVWARGIASGPDEDFETLNDTLLGALSVARKSVRIVCPYFVPSMPLIHALTVTAMRGVDVEIAIPERTNIPFVAWAALGQAGQYLQKGCRVLLSPTPFDHTKLMVVDRQWVLIGSTNWDARSLRLNFEFNVECYDRELASQLHEVAGEKMRHARELTWDELQRQSLALRLRNGLSRLLTPYL